MSNQLHIVDDSEDFETNIHLCYDFFGWKGISEHIRYTYWQGPHTIECQAAFIDACRHLDQRFETATWPQLATVIVTVAHFVGLASANYGEDPFKRIPEYKGKPIVLTDETHPYSNRHDLRRVPFGEIFFSLCPANAENPKYEKYFSSTVVQNKETSTASPISDVTIRLPVSRVKTDLRILIEALIFLVKIGFLEVTYGEYSTKREFQETTDTYRYVASLLFNLRDQYYHPIYNEGGPFLAFRPCDDSSRAFESVYHFINSTLFAETAEDILTLPQFEYENSCNNHRGVYSCPYINFERDQSSKRRKRDDNEE